MNRIFPSQPSPNGQPRDRDPVAAYLDELNVLWKQADEELAAMRVSVPVEIEVKAEYGGVYDGGSGPEPGWHDTLYLGWRKIVKDWRICVGVLTDHLDREKPSCEWKTIAESPKERRIEGSPSTHPKLKAKKMKEVREKLPSRKQPLRRLLHSNRPAPATSLTSPITDDRAGARRLGPVFNSHNAGQMAKKRAEKTRHCTLCGKS